MTEKYFDELRYSEIKVDNQITLRQLMLDEADQLYRLVDNNREYLKEWLPWVEGTQSSEDSKKFISETLEKREDGNEYGYGIFVDGKLEGHTSLMHIRDGGEPEIGYWIDETMSGQGISTKAGRALTEFGFNTLGLGKIIIKADPKNIGSNKIAEKLGYKLIHQEHDDRIGNANVYSLNKSEYNRAK